jgi:cation diffusion facilitator family transporter
MLIGDSTGIAVAAVHEIVTPHHAPAPFTLAVLAVVVLVKQALSRSVLRVGEETVSTAVKADAWHHRSVALTSAAAFVGIAIALGGGEGWESADDWAALVASGITALNRGILLRASIRELMDRMPKSPVVGDISAAARAVDEVLSIEKLMVRKLCTACFVDVHVQADPMLPLRDAHILSGKVQRAICSAVSAVAGVLVHMEPCEQVAELGERLDFDSLKARKDRIGEL